MNETYLWAIQVSDLVLLLKHRYKKKKFKASKKQNNKTERAQ